MKNDFAFLIMTGGKGSRLNPLTLDMPKCNLPLYFDDDNIYRFIDFPINYCIKNNIKMFVSVQYKKEQVPYNKNIIYIETNSNSLTDTSYQCLKIMKSYGIKKYALFASDFLVPTHVIDKMLNYSKDYSYATLCSKYSPYSKITIPCNEKYEFDNNGSNKIIDLTFFINTIDNGIELMNNITDNQLIDMWYYMNKLNQCNSVKLHMTDINNIDLGTPNAYYQALYEFNKSRIDSKGNIIFPNAKIHNESRNIVALPNSDSSDEILESSIISGVLDNKKVLKVINDDKKYFSNLNIKDYI